MPCTVYDDGYITEPNDVLRFPAGGLYGGRTASALIYRSSSSFWSRRAIKETSRPACCSCFWGDPEILTGSSIGCVRHGQGSNAIKEKKTKRVDRAGIQEIIWQVTNAVRTRLLGRSEGFVAGRPGSDGCSSPEQLRRRMNPRPPHPPGRPMRAVGGCRPSCCSSGR